MRSVARYAVALASLLLLGAAAALAVWLHGRPGPRSVSGPTAALQRDAQRLIGISTVLSGSTLPPSRGGCERYAWLDHRRTGHVYPRKGSAQYTFVMAVCSRGGPQ